MSTPEQTDPPVEAPTPDGPWAKDLAATFTDPEIATQVDAFLRGHVQPYTTGLEQKLKGLEGAEALLTDLQTNPGDTYIALTEEMFGAEAKVAAQTLLDQALGNAPTAPTEEAPVADETPAEPDTPAPAPQLPFDPNEVQALLAERQQQRDSEAYEAELAKLEAQYPELDRNTFHPFVMAAEGDLDAAYTGWQQWDAAQRAKYGEPLPVDPEAPAALGTSDAQTTPPVQEKYESLDDAMDSWFNEQKASPPAPVGAV